MRTLDKLSLEDLVKELAGIVDELNKAVSRQDMVGMRVYGKRLKEGARIMASKMDVQ